MQLMTPGAARDSAGGSVALISWPDETGSLDRLRRAGTPRLLLVEGDTPPPPCDSCIEDWVRLPSTNEEISRRSARLRMLSTTHVAPPIVDREALLRFRGDWSSLSPVQAAWLNVLIEHLGDVVSLDELLRRARPAGSTTDEALRGHVRRLRERARHVGLDVRNVYGRGYVLETPGFDGVVDAGNTRPIDAEMVVWPDGAERRRELRRRGIPRVLLVTSDARLPLEEDDCDEDWAAPSESATDISYRVAAVVARARRHLRVPVVRDGRVGYRGRWVGLSGTNARLAIPLVNHYCDVVDQATLLEQGWPHASVTHTALRVHILRLRRSVAELGLGITSVRSYGYVLEPARESSSPPAAHDNLAGSDSIRGEAGTAEAAAPWGAQIRRPAG